MAATPSDLNCFTDNIGSNKGEEWPWSTADEGWISIQSDSDSHSACWFWCLVSGFWLVSLFNFKRSKPLFWNATQYNTSKCINLFYESCMYFILNIFIPWALYVLNYNWSIDPQTHKGSYSYWLTKLPSLQFSKWFKNFHEHFSARQQSRSTNSCRLKEKSDLSAGTGRGRRSGARWRTHPWRTAGRCCAPGCAPVEWCTASRSSPPASSRPLPADTWTGELPHKNTAWNF